jgi:hypothetical protein
MPIFSLRRPKERTSPNKKDRSHCPLSGRLQIRMLWLDGTERFIPAPQWDAPWAAMRFERLQFAARFVAHHNGITDLA